MLDINLIRDHPDIVLKDLERRDDREKAVWVTEIRKMDAEWKNLHLEVDELRHLRNKLSKEVSELKKVGKDASSLMLKAKEIPELIEDKEKRKEELKEKIDFFLMNLPNILNESVPYGTSDENNKMVKLVGKKPNFDFEPKTHVEICEDLDLIDTERAGKIAGARFYFLKNELAILDHALQAYAMDFMLNKKYTIMRTPDMIRKDVLKGAVSLNDFEDVIYKIEGEDLYLIGTAEHTLNGFFSGETLEEEKLPIKFAGISSCYRKEAGTHGKDTKGVFRVHEFRKVEQFIFSTPSESWKLYEELLNNAVEFWDSLKIPFRIVNVCTGDVGIIATKKYDLEAWMPGSKTYREIVSCSHCTDYQSRRTNVRMRTKDGNIFPHTLNSTVVATPRALTVILENYQQKDGSVKIPSVLVPFMGGIKEIRKRE